MIKDFDNLPLRLYNEIVAIDENKDYDNEDKLFHRVRVLSGKSEEELNEYSIAAFGALVLDAQFLNDDAPKTDKKIKKKYKINDGLVLVPMKNVAKMTTAQYIDFNKFCAKGLDGVVDILSCFLVPEGKKYCQGYEIEEVKNAILDMSVNDCVSLSAFFFERLTSFICNIAIYSAFTAKSKMTKEQWVEAQQKISMLDSLRKNGVGYTMFIKPLRRLT